MEDLPIRCAMDCQASPFVTAEGARTTDEMALIRYVRAPVAGGRGPGEDRGECLDSVTDVIGKGRTGVRWATPCFRATTS